MPVIASTTSWAPRRPGEKGRPATRAGRERSGLGLATSGVRSSGSAVSSDPTRTSGDVIVLGASVASLAAVGGVLVAAASRHGATQSLLVGLGLVSIVVSWTVVHTIYALRYAGLYYTGPDGGIGFAG